MSKPHGSNPRHMAEARQRQAAMFRAERLAELRRRKGARQLRDETLCIRGQCPACRRTVNLVTHRCAS